MAKKRADRLTEAERRFVDEYMIDDNATRAYIRAFGDQGSYAAAASAASRRFCAIRCWWRRTAKWTFGDRTRT